MAHRRCKRCGSASHTDQKRNLCENCDARTPRAKLRQRRAVEAEKLRPKNQRHLLSLTLIG